MSSVAIIVHGGAWAIPTSIRKDCLHGVQLAVREGYRVLHSGASALDAVEVAIRVLEDTPCFDAGTGAVLNAAGKVELDAMVMDGASLKSGAVAAVANVKNPISLARMVMERSPHCLLVGEGARLFADENAVPYTPTSELVTAEAMKEYEVYKDTYSSAVSNLFNKETIGHDTVGAVAFDMQGNIACGTSTGGITGKRVGRVGDSPLIGLGGYADNLAGGCSVTGHGESIMRTLLSSRVVSNMAQGLSPSEAAIEALEHMHKRVGGKGGVICIDKSGRISHFASTEAMAWASAEGSTEDPRVLAGVDNPDGFMHFADLH